MGPSNSSLLSLPPFRCLFLHHFSPGRSHVTTSSTLLVGYMHHANARTRMRHVAAGRGALMANCSSGNNTGYKVQGTTPTTTMHGPLKAGCCWGRGTLLLAAGRHPQALRPALPPVHATKHIDMHESLIGNGTWVQDVHNIRPNALHVGRVPRGYTWMHMGPGGSIQMPNASAALRAATAKWCWRPAWGSWMPPLSRRISRVARDSAARALPGASLA